MTGADRDNQGDGGDILYRWQCPIREKISIAVGSGDDPRANAAKTVHSHIHMQDGDGHGPTGSLPADCTFDDLLHCLDQLNPSSHRNDTDSGQSAD